RVLDGHDVFGALVVDLVDHRRERRRFAGSRRSRDQDQALGTVSQLLNDLREAELVEGADLVRNHADGRPDRTALAIHVAAKARQTLNAEGQVELALLLELLLLTLVQHAVGESLGVLWREHFELRQRRELAGDPDLRVRTGREMKV